MLRQLVPEDADWVIPEQIEMKRPLGRGAFATAHVASWKGSLVAAKKLHEIFFDPVVVPVQQRTAMLTEFVRECVMQSRMRHPNIVQLYGVHIPDGDNCEPPVMLCELMAETLRARIQREPRLTFRDVIDLALQIACGLRFLHERDEPIGHRDLSANNVLLTEAGVCKIGDVGMAKVFTPAARIATTMKPGTEPYMPGEVLSTGAQYNEKLDVFSLGVLMLEMVLGHEPRPSREWNTRERVGGREGLFPIAETQRRREELNELGANHPLRPLIEQLLQPQETRPAIAEVYRELKRLESTDQYHQSPSTFLQARALNLSAVLEGFAADLRNVAQSVNDLCRQQAETTASQDQLQARVEQSQLHQAATQRQLQEVTQQQAATQQQLQNVTQKQAATQQQLQELQAVTKQLQQTTTEQHLEVITQQQTATKQQLQKVTQDLQAVMSRLEQSTTQHLQQGLDRLEESVHRSGQQRASAVKTHVTDAIDNLTLLQIAPGSATKQSRIVLKSQYAVVEDEPEWRRRGFGFFGPFFKCDACKNNIHFEEEYAVLNNLRVHKRCFRCTVCGDQLTRYKEKHGKYYCESH